MNLTSTEIFKLVWDRIRDSLLGKTVPDDVCGPLPE